MSVTILPYISQIPDSVSPAPKVTRPATSPSGPSFDETLQAKMKATAAIALDALVHASEKGMVNASMVQEYFDQHGINITVPNAASPSTNVGATVVASPQTIQTQSVATTYSASETTSPESLNPYFEEAARTYNVDVKLLKAIAFCESNFDTNAVSHSGAVGVM